MYIMCNVLKEPLLHVLAKVAQISLHSQSDQAFHCLLAELSHNENTPIQIHRNFHLIKTENFQKKKNSDIFHISAQNIDCGYSLELLHRGSSKEYQQSMFLSRNK